MLKNILTVLTLLLACGLTAQTIQPYQNPDLPVKDRVADLVSRMTLEEKVLQLFNDAPAIPRLGVPAYNWWNECLHGVARAGTATVFPQAIGLAATFDDTLMFRLSTAISDEARAKHHYFVRNNARSIYMGLTFWTPNINIFRDPRWGRGQETYGEDPYLTSRMAVNFIKGLQGDDPKYLKTIATAKHYAVHSGPEFTRHSDNMFVNDKDLYQTYLPAFRAAVREANVQSVMCAYNRFRDKPCCGSDLLLQRILREEFGFDGYVVSDCGAITDFYNKTAHDLVKTPEQAFGWSVASGTDLNCEENKWFVTNIDSAVNAGIINEKDVNVAITRLFTARFKLGMFDSMQDHPYAQIPLSTVGSAKHLKLAETAAGKSFVLLKNDGILPLKKGVRVALLGPNANNSAVLIGNYNGDPVNPVTPLKGLREYLGSDKVTYSPACPIIPDAFTDFETVPAAVLYHIENGKLRKGLTAAYYKSPDLSGDAMIRRTDADIRFDWETSPVTGKMNEPFSVRWSGVIVPATTAKYQFSTNLAVRINGVSIDEKPVLLEKGKRYNLEADLLVNAFWWASNYQQQHAHLRWTNTSIDYAAEALRVASNADVIIFCGGISPNLEGEEMKIETPGFAHGDRTDLELPLVQRSFLQALVKTGKPVVYVNFSGSAVALNWENENVNAILQGFYPGEGTGRALAKILFGEINPSGRLPVTFYKSAEDLPEFEDYRMAGRTYRYFKGKPLFPFGYGLSYTTFRYSNASGPAAVTAGTTVNISFDLANTGKRDGEEVVQVYLKHETTDSGVPIRSLVAYKRVFLKAGETKRITLAIDPEQTSLINEMYDREIQAGKITCSIGGKQPDEAAGSGNGVDLTFEIQGAAKLK